MKPLEGVLVVALEQAVAAPLATQRLAEAGARVIKIERAEGDFARGYDRAANGASSYFTWLNQGKESIALDLKTPDDLALAHRLVARADVFVQNLAQGAATRLGLGADALRVQHPRLICADVTGFGTGGPSTERKAYDLLMQAESGVISVSGGPGEMGRIGVSLADIGTGLNMYGAITTALVRQARTGLGAHLEVSLFDTLAEWMTVPLLHHDYLNAAPERIGLAHPSIAPYGAFKTSDGRTLLISIQSDREWRVLAGLIEQPDMADNPRFATNGARIANRAETDGAVATAFKGMTSAVLCAALDQARIAYGEANDVAGLSAHPHLRRRTVSVGDHNVALPETAIRSDWSQGARAPDIDEHGTAIREEFCA